jgi:hypothetical protein
MILTVMNSHWQHPLVSPLFSRLRMNRAVAHGPAKYRNGRRAPYHALSLDLMSPKR